MAAQPSTSTIKTAATASITTMPKPSTSEITARLSGKSIWSNIKEFCTITDRGTCLLVLLTKLHFLVAMALHPRLINVDIHLQAPALEEQTIGAT